VRASWAAPGTLALESADDRWEATFTAEGAELTADADALLCAGLLPAMATGEGLELDEPVSADLLRNAERLVDVFAAWWPDELTHVPVVAQVARARRRRRAGADVLAFSGGVRSLAALVSAPPGQATLVVEGMGEVAPPPSSAGRITAHTDLAAVLAATGVPAAACAPTVVLAVVAHVLDRIDHLEVASSFGWVHQFAHGSHVLTDPLWSGTTTLAATGAALDRVAALERVVNGPFDARPVGADGVLTGATLRVLGVSWPDVPPVDLDAVRALPVVGPAELAHVAELLLRLGPDEDPELRAALEEAVRSTTAAGIAWPEGWTRVLADLGRARSS
jgi:hypothetical protein